MVVTFVNRMFPDSNSNGITFRVHFLSIYYTNVNNELQLVGLASTRQEFKGLSVNVRLNNQDNQDNQANINLFGDFSLWLRIIESAQARE